MFEEICDLSCCVCDLEGRIVVFDWLYYKIYILIVDGCFIGYFLIEDDGIYFLFCVLFGLDGVLWIGCKLFREVLKGDIVRVKYKC